MRSVPVLGLDCADIPVAHAAAIIAARGPGFPFAYVVTPNADHFIRLHRIPALRPLYEPAWLRLLDSRVVAGLRSALGLPSPRVVTGSDLLATLLDFHIRPTDRVTVIGACPSAVAALRARVAHHVPPPRMDRDPAAMRAAVDFVLANPARYVLLAVGSPRQEMLAHAIAATGRATGTGLCIGAALDLVAAETTGGAARAPSWLRRAGLEWLHRLAREPRRLARRYLWDDPPILVLLLRERLRRSG